MHQLDMLAEDVQIDRYLRVQEHLLTNPQAVKSKLTFPNPAYGEAVKNDRPTAGIPPFLRQWEPGRPGELVLPRHCLPTFKVPVHLQWPVYPTRRSPFQGTGEFRNDTQREAVAWLTRDRHDKRLMLNAGAGKTVVALIAAGRMNLAPILVVVHERATMEQWIDRISEHTNYPREEIGVVQGGKIELRPVMVAMMQTLALGEDRGKDFDDLRAHMHGGLQILDELDVYPAAKMQRCLSMFDCVRWGLTATYRREQELQQILELHVGLGTKWEFYRREYELSPIVVSCRVQVPPYVGSYHSLPKLLTNLEENCRPYREVILGLVREAVGKKRKVLLLLQRVEAIEGITLLLKQEGIDADCIHGGRGQRERLKTLRERQVVVATRSIAGRALDAPDIDTIITGPTSNPALIEQIAGRSLRVHDDKLRPVVVILWPGASGVASNQLAGMATKSVRVLRRIGFNDVRSVSR